MKNIYPLDVSKEQYIDTVLQFCLDNNVFSEDQKSEIVTVLVKRIDTLFNAFVKLEHKQQIVKDLQNLGKSGEHTYDFYDDTFKMFAAFLFKNSNSEYVHYYLSEVFGFEMPEGISEHLDFISMVTARILQDICCAVDEKLKNEQTSVSSTPSLTDNHASRESTRPSENVLGMSRFFTEEFSFAGVEEENSLLAKYYGGGFNLS